MNLEERHWDRLLEDIEGGQVIPLIGPELLQVVRDGHAITLHHHLASRLIERLELDPVNLPAGCGFDQVVIEFLAQQPGHPAGYEREDIYYQIRKLMEHPAWPTPPALRQLAEIRHFDLFASTTFDLLMEQAIDEVRLAGQPRCRSYSYCRREKPVDLPDDFRPQDAPTVFHFFGTLNPMNDFAVTDEDILQYAHRLQSRDFRPQNLFDQMRDKRLLTLGCSFPGWLTRFFLVAAKGDDLFRVGAPGVLADVLSNQDRGLVGFLERKRTSVYAQGDAVKFVGELHARWTSRFGNAPSAVVSDRPDGSLPTDMAPESVFISFRSDDRDTARQVAARFRDAGIDTWFDETDLEPGDRYKEKIANHIFKCFAFVPLVSKHSVSGDPQPWFYRFEWRRAIEAADFRSDASRFILPLLVDDTSPKDEAIPAAFRALHIAPLAKLDEVVAGIKERLRAQRRERRTV